MMGGRYEHTEKERDTYRTERKRSLVDLEFAQFWEFPCRASSTTMISPPAISKNHLCSLTSDTQRIQVWILLPLFFYLVWTKIWPCSLRVTIFKGTRESHKQQATTKPLTMREPCRATETPCATVVPPDLCLFPRLTASKSLKVLTDAKASNTPDQGTETLGSRKSRIKILVFFFSSQMSFAGGSFRATK